MLDFIDKVSFSKVPQARVLQYGSHKVDDDNIWSLPDELLVHESPFELKGTSWNAVNIDITIFLKKVLNVDPIRLQHRVDLKNPQPPQIQTVQTNPQTDVTLPAPSGKTKKQLVQLPGLSPRSNHTSTAVEEVEAQILA